MRSVAPAPAPFNSTTQSTSLMNGLLSRKYSRIVVSDKADLAVLLIALYWAKGNNSVVGISQPKVNDTIPLTVVFMSRRIWSGVLADQSVEAAMPSFATATFGTFGLEKKPGKS